MLDLSDGVRLYVPEVSRYAHAMVELLVSGLVGRLEEPSFAPQPLHTKDPDSEPLAPVVGEVAADFLYPAPPQRA